MIQRLNPRDRSVGFRKKIYYKDWSTGPIVTFSFDSVGDPSLPGPLLSSQRRAVHI
jgi:hypothetical protein